MLDVYIASNNISREKILKLNMFEVCYCPSEKINERKRIELIVSVYKTAKL
jgi:hypothetical protein